MIISFRSSLNSIQHHVTVMQVLNNRCLHNRASKVENDLAMSGISPLFLSRGQISSFVLIKLAKRLL